MLSPKRAHTVHNNRSQPYPTNTGCDFNSRMVYLTHVPYSRWYWIGAVMHQWEPMICRQRALEYVNIKPKPPTLTDLRQSRTESQGNKLWPRRDIMCFYCSFVSPSGETSVLFDIRPTCSSDEHKCRVECVWGSSVIVCSALSDPQSPTCTHGHRLSLLFLCLSLSLSIDCCNQTAGCSQVIWECSAIYHFSNPCWVKYYHFLHNQVTEWMRSQVKRRTKGKHKSITMEKEKL